MTIRFDLGERKVYRNSSEYHWKPTCRYGDVTVESYTAPIIKLAGLLLEENPQFNPLVEVYRGETLVFTAAPLKSWIGGLPARGTQPEQLRKE